MGNAKAVILLALLYFALKQRQGIVEIGETELTPPPPGENDPEADDDDGNAGNGFDWDDT